MNKKNLLVILLGVFALSFHLSAQDKTGMRSITTGEYCFFLNAEAATDSYGLYDEKMAINATGASILRSGVPGSYHYDVVPEKENIPIGGISFSNAICYAHWFRNEDNLIACAEEKSDEELKSNQRCFLMESQPAAELVQSSGEELFLTSWEEGAECLIGLASLFWSEGRAPFPEEGVREEHQQRHTVDQKEPWQESVALDRSDEMKALIDSNRFSDAENIYARGKDLTSIQNPLTKANFLGAAIAPQEREPLREVLSRVKYPSTALLKKEESLSLNDHQISNVQTMPLLIARKEALQRAIHYAKDVTKYAEDTDKATMSVDRVMRLAKDNKRIVPFMTAAFDIELAIDVITAAVEHAETHLAHLGESPQLADAEACHQDASFLLELKLALTAVKEAAEKTQSAAEVAMDDDKYKGTIATDALASIRTLQVSHDTLFENVDAITTSLPVMELQFPTLDAKKAALHHSIQHAEIVAKYASDLRGEPVKNFSNALMASDNTEITDEYFEQLSDARSKVVVALTTSAIAIRNAKERLDQWEVLSGENTLSSSQKEAQLFASLDVTTQALEKSTEDLVLKLQPVKEYEELWPIDVEKALVGLKAAQETYKASLESLK